MKKTGLFALSLLAVILIINGCGSDDNGTAFRQVQTIDLDHGIFNYQTVREGDAHSGKKFSRADSANNFGLGYSFLIPDTMKSKGFAVTIDCWVRTGDMANNCDIVLSCTANDSILLWTGCGAKDFIRNPNEWAQVVKTIVIPADLTGRSNTYVNVMGHNIDAKSYLDIDDLKIEYAEIPAAK